MRIVYSCKRPLKCVILDGFSMLRNDGFRADRVYGGFHSVLSYVICRFGMEGEELKQFYAGREA